MTRLKVSFDGGIVITNKDHRLILDPSRRIRYSEGVLVCVSHAHSDHVKKHGAAVLSTPETADLFPYKINSTPEEYGKSVDFDGMTVTQHSANHILGSSQFEITDGNETLVYTGDFRLNESLLFGSCEVPECDTLIVESTYGKPSFRFPLMKDVAEEVEKWVKEKSRSGRNIVFGSYSLGKSQEVISILNEMGIVPVVHPKIAHYSSIYNRHGHSLSFVESGTSEGNKMLSNRFVAVMPQNLVDAGFISAIEEATGRFISSA
ncbi:MAG: MBL fold metallo-hydrolase, partial [archaeon]